MTLPLTFLASALTLTAPMTNNDKRTLFIDVDIDFSPTRPDFVHKDKYNEIFGMAGDFY